jgi:hypothetical protein
MSSSHWIAVETETSLCMFEGTSLGDLIEEQEYLKEEHALQQSLELAHPLPIPHFILLLTC